MPHPVILAVTVPAIALLGWSLWRAGRFWRSIPRSNADFGCADARATRPASANPAGNFYGGGLLVRTLGTALRLIDRVAPRWAVRTALHVFVTPLHGKGRGRLPERWERSTWAFESVRLATWRQRGLAAGRPVVLLVHGWAGSGAQMARLGDALAAAGYDPVLLDFPAHGESSGWRSTLPQFSRALFAAVARLGPLHAVVAHSLGALATMHAAARGLPVGRLVLVSPSAPPAEFLQWFGHTFGLPESVPARMRRALEAREAVPLHEFEPEWLGPRIGQRTLVIHDQADRVAPFASAERIVAALPASRLRATTGLGHRRVLDDYAVAGSVLAHLRAAG